MHFEYRISNIEYRISNIINRISNIEYQLMHPLPCVPSHADFHLKKSKLSREGKILSYCNLSLETWNSCGIQHGAYYF
jgi:hypothetical protein